MPEFNYRKKKENKLKLIFLKLGGSLITDKDKPYSARLDIIRSAAEQIVRATTQNPDMHILIGHGSGSFGHSAAKNSGYSKGEFNKTNWHGFQSIWFAAHSLNRILIEEFFQAGLPVVSFPPSAAVNSKNKKIISWNIEPIKATLSSGLIPVIYGDIIFDQDLGGIIYSTEELFLYLINELNPGKILLAGKEEGVWADFPDNSELIRNLSKNNIQRYQSSINSSQYVDVTGGMQKKVELMFMVQDLHPDIQINIFSGEIPGLIFQALSGKDIGTKITKK